MFTKTLTIHDLVKANLNRFSSQEVVRLMRWSHPIHIENMGTTYKTFIDKEETTQSLMLGYIIKDYLTKRIGEPK